MERPNKPALGSFNEAVKNIVSGGGAPIGNDAYQRNVISASIKILEKRKLELADTYNKELHSTNYAKRLTKEEKVVKTAKILEAYKNAANNYGNLKSAKAKLRFHDIKVLDKHGLFKVGEP